MCALEHLVWKIANDRLDEIFQKCLIVYNWYKNYLLAGTFGLHGFVIFFMLKILWMTNVMQNLFIYSIYTLRCIEDRWSLTSCGTCILSRSNLPLCTLGVERQEYLFLSHYLSQLQSHSQSTTMIFSLLACVISNLICIILVHNVHSVWNGILLVFIKSPINLIIKS